MNGVIMTSGIRSRDIAFTLATQTSKMGAHRTNFALQGSSQKYACEHVLPRVRRAVILTSLSVVYINYITVISYAVIYASEYIETV